MGGMSAGRPGYTQTVGDRRRSAGNLVVIGKAVHLLAPGWKRVGAGPAGINAPNRRPARCRGSFRGVP